MPNSNRLALYLGLFLVVAAVAVFGLRMMNPPAKAAPKQAAVQPAQGQASPLFGTTARSKPAADPNAHPEHAAPSGGQPMDM